MTMIMAKEEKCIFSSQQFRFTVLQTGVERTVGNEPIP
jgi:hypothetical protein